MPEQIPTWLALCLSVLACLAAWGAGRFKRETESSRETQQSLERALGFLEQAQAGNQESLDNLGQARELLAQAQGQLGNAQEHLAEAKTLHAEAKERGRVAAERLNDLRPLRYAWGKKKGDPDASWPAFVRWLESCVERVRSIEDHEQEPAEPDGNLFD